ncbi:MAG: sigma-54-dependent transcriptional regulator [Clostridiales bacterium]
MDTILVIDDNESMRETLEYFLREIDCRLFIAECGKSGLEIIEKENPDLIITDLRLPDIDGIEILKRAKEFDKNIQVVVMTAFEDISSTIKAMQMNAYDYFRKPIDYEQLLLTVKKALEGKKLCEQMSISSNNEITELQHKNNLIGNNPLMHELYKKIGKVSSNRINILVQGESGTGKELVTRVIHYSGITKEYPFIAVNCTALSPSLLESELFGHVKGSFTGAIKDKKGKFELAGEGTIFLDEISEISPNIQVKLLRVLQEREFERVGGELTIPMKARIVAATNKNLEELVGKGHFREDLFYRLNVFTITIPPLRDRKDDIPKLVVSMLAKINRELHKNVRKIPFDVMEMLINHTWVGNVRELENTLLQAVVLAQSDVLEKEYLMLKGTQKNLSVSSKADLSLADIEKEHIKLVLDSVKWNKQKACKILGITKPTLNTRIEQYSISP